MSIIELKNVSFSYNYSLSDEVKAIDDISLEINEGEFVALVGHNGSGKSTIARLLNGLLIPQKGQVLIDSLDTSNPKNLYDIRSNLGVVFQNPDNQTVASIIEDDVAFGPENLGLKSEEIRERVDWALKSVSMYEYKDGTPFRLSGGQKQRVAIAGVLALKPKIMVLDESTSMLDPIGRNEVLSVITNLNKKEKMTVIMITHFMEEASLADRVIVMKEGKITLDDKAEQVFLNEQKIVDAGLELLPVCRISSKLRQQGINLPKGILSMDSLVDYLKENKCL